MLKFSRYSFPTRGDRQTQRECITEHMLHNVSVASHTPNTHHTLQSPRSLPGEFKIHPSKYLSHTRPEMPTMAQGAFKDSMTLSFALHTTYRTLLRSSSLQEPRDPLLKVVSFHSTVTHKHANVRLHCCPAQQPKSSPTAPAQTRPYQVQVVSPRPAPQPTNQQLPPLT